MDYTIQLTHRNRLARLCCTAGVVCLGQLPPLITFAQHFRRAATRGIADNNKCAATPSLNRLLGLLMLLSVFAHSGQAQQFSSVSYGTPAALANGAPVGSAALSRQESINIYNGNVNYSLPLLTIGGRSEASYTMTYAVDPPSWITEQTLTSGADCSITHTCVPTFQWVNLFARHSWKPRIYDGAGYGPGVLHLRHVGMEPVECSDGTQYAQWMFTYLEFTTPDGTEHALYDERDLGVVDFQCVYLQHPPANYEGPGANRGKVFSTRDGSRMTFASDNNIQDVSTPAFYDDMNPGTRVLTPTGYLIMSNGTRYRIELGLVKLIIDRNGNQLTLEYPPADTGRVQGRVQKITDSLGREVKILYDQHDAELGVNCDQIIYKSGGVEKKIRIGSISNTYYAGQVPIFRTPAGQSVPAQFDRSATGRSEFAV